MKDCPCCSNQMIRQVYDKQVYWFCRHCWQPMFIYDLNKWGSLTSTHFEAGVKQKKEVVSILS